MNKEKQNLEELFKSELGDYSQVPSASVWKKIRRNLFRKQLFRFHPGNLNIYYLGGIIIAGAGLIFILVNDPEQEALSNNFPQQEMTDSTVKNEPETEETELIISEKKTKEETRDTAVDVVQISKVPEYEDESYDSATLYDLAGENQENVNLPEEEHKTIRHLPSPPISFFSVNKSKGCEPLKVSFSNLSENSQSWIWNFGNGQVSSEKNPEHLFEDAGIYRVELVATGRNRKTSTFTTDIHVYPKPEVNFEIDSIELSNNNITVLFQNKTEGADSFYWDFGDGSSSDLKDPEHIYSRPGSYGIFLKASTDKGCSDSLLVEIDLPSRN